MTTGQILIVDDDAAFVDLYRELLEAEGYRALVANTPEAGTQILETRGSEIDVVLIDQKLQGPGGPDVGLELLARVRQLTPFAKSIIVTGYSSPEAIARAFAEGVYDYLVKNGAFEALLKAKVRNAVEITSERRLASLGKEARDRALRETWEASKIETNPNRKGALLEELIRLLFMGTPGFELVTTRLRNVSEEIDISVRNETTGGVWSKEGPYILAECKNWSGKADAREYAVFRDKLANKFNRARAGLFFSVGGFTKGFEEKLIQDRKGDVLIVAVDADGIERWISATDRLSYLEDIHQKATLGA